MRGDVSSLRHPLDTAVDKVHRYSQLPTPTYYRQYSTVHMEDLKSLLLFCFSPSSFIWLTPSPSFTWIRCKVRTKNGSAACREMKLKRFLSFLVCLFLPIPCLAIACELYVAVSCNQRHAFVRFFLDCEESHMGQNCRKAQFQMRASVCFRRWKKKLVILWAMETYVSR